VATSPVCVDFVMVSGVARQQGGDAVQIAKTSAALRELGVDCRMVPYSSRLALRPGAIPHLVNTALPYEFLDAVAQCRPRPYVVTSIHHSRQRLRLMRESQPTLGVRSLIGRVTGEATRDWLAAGSRLANGSIGGRARPLARGANLIRNAPHTWRRVGSALERAAFVCTLADAERRDLQMDTGWSADNDVRVPNGLEDPGDRGVSWNERDPTLLVVGRIEPRKRQLEVAEAAVRASVPVRFVGAAARREPSYSQRFARVVAQNAELLEWIGPLDQVQLFERYRRTRVMLNASWVEVQSLVDLEALVHGCAVVSGPTGSTAERFSSGVTVVESDDVSDLLAAAVEAASGRARLPEPVDGQWGWAQVAVRLRSRYAALRDG
jgi:glycosyltransferase involved in cell wall biosynthesis